MVEDSLRQKMKGCITEEKVEACSELFDRTRKTLQGQSDEYRQYIALKLNYVDLRQISEKLYIPEVSMERSLQKLYPETVDPLLGMIVNNLPEGLVNRLIGSFFSAFIRVYEKILMEGGKERVFATDHSDFLIDEIVFIENMFAIKEGSSFGVDSEGTIIAHYLKQ